MNMGNYPVIMCMEGNATFTGCTVNSGKVGVMAHGGNGQGTLIVNKGTVFNTERAVFQIKGRGITMNIDDATLNSKENDHSSGFPQRRSKWYAWRR